MPSRQLSASARRYADAAFDVARETNSFDQWQSMLDGLARVMAIPSARAVFFSPTVSSAEKMDALDRIFPGETGVLRNFLTILAERGRLPIADEIAEAFRERVNQERGILAVDVTTAVPLDAEMQRTIAQRLGRFLNHDPQHLAIRSSVDPEILGGVVARIGDRLIDDSVRGRLNRLKRALATGA